MFDFHVDDWVVHLNYGVGQVRALETRTISGEETRYYKIKTADNLFVWVPVSDTDEGILRGLTPANKIEDMLAVFSREAKELPRKSYGRQSRIKESRESHSLVERARLVRDLWMHRQENSMGMQERKALKWATAHLVAEWALITDKRPQEVEQRLNKLLQTQLLQTDLTIS